MSRSASLNFAALAAITGTFGSAQVYAQQVNAPIEEIVVTATKRVQSQQDVPVAVTALSSRTLQELNIDNFTDYLQELPNVTAGGSGPGQNTIYVRGLASTTPNLTTAGVAGLAPNVALYLDEQPLSQPGRNLDVYSVDLERIEVLPGPQGTLFGASSQAGTIRLITNKPVLNRFEAFANFDISFTESGEMSTKAEGMVNVPILEDTLAVRAVVFNDDQGGYIDNVQGMRDASVSARFREAGTVRDNGVPVSDFREGIQAGSDLSGVTFLETNNSDLTEVDFNDTTYSGFRTTVLWQITQDWKFTVSHMRQELDSDGVFFVDPDLGDLEIQRFEEDRLEDGFQNTAWTLEGRVADLDIVYTGAYTDRDTDQRVDYTDYLFVGQYLPYYICDGSVTYPGAAAPSGTCQEPNLFVDSNTELQVLTQEFRVSTPEKYRIHATTGVFYRDLELIEVNDFTYPGSEEANHFGFIGFPPNFPFMTGFATNPNEPFPEGVIFRNDVKRTDEQIGLFGEVTFEVIPDTVNVIFGARYYDVTVDLEGGANSSFCNSSGVDEDAFGTDISDLYNDDGEFTFRGTCNDDLRQTFTEDQSLQEIIDAGLSEAQAQRVRAVFEQAPDEAVAEGVIFKGTVNYTPNRNMLFYFTFSQGFRPGLLNRPGGAEGPGNFTVPFELDTDDVNNFEIGWKLDLFENSVRFNGNAFFMDISDLQTTIFDPNIVNLFFSDNAADAEILGAEGDITWYPPNIPGLTFNFAFSVLDTEITKVITPTGDVQEGDELAFAPNFQGSFRGRYEWTVFDDYTAHVMPTVSYTGSSQSDIVIINRAEVDDYVKFGFATGLRKDRWSVELYGDNLNDARGQITNNFVFDRKRITLIRPRTVGLRFGVTY